MQEMENRGEIICGSIVDDNLSTLRNKVLRSRGEGGYCVNRLVTFDYIQITLLDMIAHPRAAMLNSKTV